MGTQYHITALPHFLGGRGFGNPLLPPNLLGGRAFWLALSPPLSPPPHTTTPVTDHGIGIGLSARWPAVAPTATTSSRRPRHPYTSSAVPRFGVHACYRYTSSAVAGFGSRPSPHLPGGRGLRLAPTTTRRLRASACAPQPTSRRWRAPARAATHLFFCFSF